MRLIVDTTTTLSIAGVTGFSCWCYIWLLLLCRYDPLITTSCSSSSSSFNIKLLGSWLFNWRCDHLSVTWCNWWKLRFFISIWCWLSCLSRGKSGGLGFRGWAIVTDDYRGLGWRFSAHSSFSWYTREMRIVYNWSIYHWLLYGCFIDHSWCF